MNRVHCLYILNVPNIVYSEYTKHIVTQQLCIVLDCNGVHSHITTPGLTIRWTIIGPRVVNAVDAKNAILLYWSHHCHSALHLSAMRCSLPAIPCKKMRSHANLYQAVHGNDTVQCMTRAICKFNVQCLTRGKHADMNWVLGKVRRLPRYCYSCSPETHWAIN